MCTVLTVALQKLLTSRVMQTEAQATLQALELRIEDKLAAVTKFQRAQQQWRAKSDACQQQIQAAEAQLAIIPDWSNEVVACQLGVRDLLQSLAECRAQQAAMEAAAAAASHSVKPDAEAVQPAGAGHVTVDDHRQQHEKAFDARKQELLAHVAAAEAELASLRGQKK